MTQQNRGASKYFNPANEYHFYCKPEDKEKLQKRLSELNIKKAAFHDFNDKEGDLTVNCVLLAPEFEALEKDGIVLVPGTRLSRAVYLTPVPPKPRNG